jgi:hypothetical protein
MLNVMKILLVGVEFFYANGRTDGQAGRQRDMTRIIVAFHSFANVPNKVNLPFPWYFEQSDPIFP